MASILLDNAVKCREGKKWKNRWCVLKKLSPVADCLHVFVYKLPSGSRSSSTERKLGREKACVALEQYCGVETGYQVDREPHVLAVLCVSRVLLLAFQRKDTLLDWLAVIRQHLGHERSYSALLADSPPSSGLPQAPVRLCVIPGRLTLITGLPPTVLASVLISHIRRFGAGDSGDKFSFEVGSRAGKGSGVFTLLTDYAGEIERLVQKLSLSGGLARRKTHTGVISPSISLSSSSSTFSPPLPLSPLTPPPLTPLTPSPLTPQHTLTHSSPVSTPHTPHTPGSHTAFPFPTPTKQFHAYGDLGVSSEVSLCLKQHQGALSASYTEPPRDSQVPPRDSPTHRHLSTSCDELLLDCRSSGQRHYGGHEYVNTAIGAISHERYYENVDPSTSSTASSLSGSRNSSLKSRTGVVRSNTSHAAHGHSRSLPVDCDPEIYMDLSDILRKSVQSKNKGSVKDGSSSTVGSSTASGLDFLSRLGLSRGSSRHKIVPQASDPGEYHTSDKKLSHLPTNVSVLQDYSSNWENHTYVNDLFTDSESEKLRTNYINPPESSTSNNGFAESGMDLLSEILKECNLDVSSFSTSPEHTGDSRKINDQSQGVIGNYSSCVHSVNRDGDTNNLATGVNSSALTHANKQSSISDNQSNSAIHNLPRPNISSTVLPQSSKIGTVITSSPKLTHSSPKAHKQSPKLSKQSPKVLRSASSSPKGAKSSPIATHLSRRVTKLLLSKESNQSPKAVFSTTAKQQQEQIKSNSSSIVTNSLLKGTNSSPKASNSSIKVTNSSPKATNSSPKALNSSLNVTNSSPKATNSSLKVTNSSEKLAISPQTSIQTSPPQQSSILASLLYSAVDKPSHDLLLSAVNKHNQRLAQREEPTYYNIPAVALTLNAEKSSVKTESELVQTDINVNNAQQQESLKSSQQYSGLTQDSESQSIKDQSKIRSQDIKRADQRPAFTPLHGVTYFCSRSLSTSAPDVYDLAKKVKVSDFKSELLDFRHRKPYHGMMKNCHRKSSAALSSNKPPTKTCRKSQSLPDFDPLRPLEFVDLSRYDGTDEGYSHEVKGTCHPSMPSGYDNVAPEYTNISAPPGGARHGTQGYDNLSSLPPAIPSKKGRSHNYGNILCSAHSQWVSNHAHNDIHNGNTSQWADNRPDSDKMMHYENIPETHLLLPAALPPAPIAARTHPPARGRGHSGGVYENCDTARNCDLSTSVPPPVPPKSSPVRGARSMLPHGGAFAMHGSLRRPKPQHPEAPGDKSADISGAYVLLKGGESGLSMNACHDTNTHTANPTATRMQNIHNKTHPPAFVNKKKSGKSSTIVNGSPHAVRNIVDGVSHYATQAQNASARNVNGISHSASASSSQNSQEVAGDDGGLEANDPRRDNLANLITEQRQTGHSNQQPAVYGRTGPPQPLPPRRFSFSTVPPAPSSHTLSPLPSHSLTASHTAPSFQVRPPSITQLDLSHNSAFTPLNNTLNSKSSPQSLRSNVPPASSSVAGFRSLRRIGSAGNVIDDDTYVYSSDFTPLPSNGIRQADEYIDMSVVSSAASSAPSHAVVSSPCHYATPRSVITQSSTMYSNQITTCSNTMTSSKTNQSTRKQSSSDSPYMDMGFMVNANVHLHNTLPLGSSTPESKPKYHTTPRKPSCNTQEVTYVNSTSCFPSNPPPPPPYRKLLHSRSLDNELDEAYIDTDIIYAAINERVSENTCPSGGSDTLDSLYSTSSLYNRSQSTPGQPDTNSSLYNRSQSTPAHQDAQYLPMSTINKYANISPDLRRMDRLGGSDTEARSNALSAEHTDSEGETEHKSSPAPFQGLLEMPAYTEKKTSVSLSPKKTSLDDRGSSGARDDDTISTSSAGSGTSARRGSKGLFARLMRRNSSAKDLGKIHCKSEEDILEVQVKCSELASPDGSTHKEHIYAQIPEGGFTRPVPSDPPTPTLPPKRAPPRVVLPPRGGEVMSGRVCLEHGNLTDEQKQTCTSLLAGNHRLLTEPQARHHRLLSERSMTPPTPPPNIPLPAPPLPPPRAKHRSSMSECECLESSPPVPPKSYRLRPPPLPLGLRPIEPEYVDIDDDDFPCGTGRETPVSQCSGDPPHILDPIRDGMFEALTGGQTDRQTDRGTLINTGSRSLPQRSQSLRSHRDRALFSSHPSSPLSTLATTARPRTGREYSVVDRRRWQGASGCESSSPQTPATPPGKSPRGQNIFSFDFPPRMKMRGHSRSKSLQQGSGSDTDSCPQSPALPPSTASPQPTLINRSPPSFRDPDHVYMNLTFPKVRSASPVVNLADYANVVLNYAEIDLSRGEGKAEKALPPRKSDIDYAMIDMVATAAASRAGKEHARHRENSLRQKQLDRGPSSRAQEKGGLRGKAGPGASGTSGKDSKKLGRSNSAVARVSGGSVDRNHSLPA